MVSGFISVVSSVLYLCIFVLGVVSVAALVWFLFDKKKFFSRFNGFFRDVFGFYGLIIVFFISLASVVGSLFYSEIAKFPVCTFCWYERIFMYPLVFILGLGILIKDKGFVKYVFLLSWVGFLISLYHYALQIKHIFVIAGSTCSSAGVNCGSTYVMGLGFITIPLMAVVAFGSIIVVLSLRRRALKKSVRKKGKKRK